MNGILRASAEARTMAWHGLKSSCFIFVSSSYFLISHFLAVRVFCVRNGILVLDAKPVHDVPAQARSFSAHAEPAFLCGLDVLANGGLANKIFVLAVSPLRIRSGEAHERFF